MIDPLVAIVLAAASGLAGAFVGGWVLLRVERLRWAREDARERRERLELFYTAVSNRQATAFAWAKSMLAHEEVADVLQARVVDAAEVTRRQLDLIYLREPALATAAWELAAAADAFITAGESRSADFAPLESAFTAARKRYADAADPIVHPVTEPGRLERLKRRGRR